MNSNEKRGSHTTTESFAIPMEHVLKALRAAGYPLAPGFMCTASIQAGALHLEFRMTAPVQLETDLPQD